MTQLLLIAAVYLGFMTMCNRPQATDTRTPDQVMTAITNQANLVRDAASINHITIADALVELNQGKAGAMTADQVAAALGTTASAVAPQMNSSQSLIADLQKPNDHLSADDDLKQLEILNSLVCDISAAKIEAQYERQIEGLKTLTPQQKKDALLRAGMLLADTQLKAASERVDIQRAAFANDIVVRLSKTDQNSPAWNEPITVAPSPKFPGTQVTPAQIVAELNQVSDYVGRNSKVWGFFPGFAFTDFVIHLTGAVPGFSYWFGCLLLAVLVRGLAFPFTQRQMMHGRQMQQLMPLVNEIKEQYKNKPNGQQELQQKTMELYKEYGLNPLAGCVPALFQMPLFWLVYYSMLEYRFEFQKGVFLWINPTTSAASHFFFARNLGEKDYLLIVFYAITMVCSTLLQPVSDPSNMRQQRLMGVGMSAVFGVMMFFWPVPSAFILYWTFSNILASAQGYRSYRLPLPPLVKKNSSSGGVFPVPSMRPGPSKEGNIIPNGKNGQFNGKPKSTGAPKIHKPKKKK